MTAETASQVVRYIVAHRGDEKIKISWFGGEPLVNVKVIDQICTELNGQGVPFRSEMITNGYLFDADMVQRAKNLWQLQKVQITLDGTAQTYNRVKAYVYQGVNAFERVLENIGQLIAVGIRVLIRLNVDKHNIGEMAELAELLHQHFGSNEHLSVYSHELFGERTSEDNATLFAQRMQLEQQIAKHSILRIKELPKDILLNQCMADNDQSVMIAPDGHLGKCEHFIDREFFGHIDSEERDMAIIRKFKERRAEIEACATCPFYPLCYRLVMCENDSGCIPETRQGVMHNMMASIKYEYERYLKLRIR
jgi:radical SAM protein with 4Fe4S-binding SPASM domain